MLQSSNYNTNSFNTVGVSNSSAVADERSDILAWLSPLDPKSGHQNIQGRRVKDVGEWLLQTEEFKSWHAGNGGDGSDNAVLFCYGHPGVGKTYISSLVIDTLCDQARGQNIAVACFYVGLAAQEERSSTSMLGALLKQLVVGLKEVPGEIVEAYEEQKNFIGGRRPQHTDIVKMLQTASSKKRTFICIDALDECDRAKVLDSLSEILHESPTTKIFVTGRPHIRPEIARRLTGRAASLSLSTKRDDIIRYLCARLKDDTAPDAMNSSLETEILGKVPEDFSEMFLLVSLNIDAVLQETTIHRRRQKLSAMTNGLWLGDAYGATLGRIKGQGGEKARLGMAALMWVSHAERPLKAEELCHALAVEIGSPDLNTDNVPSIGTLLACCQGLIVVNKEASMVRLIHFTVQEYLRAHPELFGAAHSTMAETCLSYLNSQQVKALSVSLPRNLQGTPSPEDSSSDLGDSDSYSDWEDCFPYSGSPFLEYSSLYWGAHAKRDLSDFAKQLALKLFDDYKNCMPTKIFLQAQKTYCQADFEKVTLFSGLHYASFFGIDQIVAGLVEIDGCDAGQMDCEGNIPLIWAAKNGHEGVFTILLGRDDVNLDKPDNNGQTPLWWAAYNGHEGVVKVLLGRSDVNPDKPDNNGQTPLRCAAMGGHEEVVRVLLGRDDVSPDKQDNYGQTALSGAAYNGHPGVVKILLGRDDVSPDKPDNKGQTPLWWAALRGHERVVKVLLGRGDVNPDKPDNDGQTPLLWAANNGHSEVVKILLGRSDVNPDKSDNNGQTPLRHAAMGGHEEVVRVLLRRDDVSSDKPNNNGQTPLSGAAYNGHEGVVKILLGGNNVNPDKPDNDGQTPLWWAALRGHEGVVRMLLGRGDVNPNRLNKNGEAPLGQATEKGHKGVIALLQAREPVAPNVSFRSRAIALLTLFKSK